MNVIVAGILVLALSTDAAARQATWFPPEMEASVVEQLAERLTEIDAGKPAQGRNERARSVIATIRSRIDQWGPATLVARAPKFAELKMPDTPSEHLDAMARYSVCNLELFLQHLQPSNPANISRREEAALGLSAFTMAVFRLREPFLAAGGTDAAMEAFLSDNLALDAEFDRIQSEPALLTHVRTGCAPVLKALVE
jgi:hypothetical protein